LLEAELDSTDLREYTQVIIQETNRLQSLLDRLLTPAKRPVVQAVNVHEVLERVRSLIQRRIPAACNSIAITTPACRNSKATRNS
jgi:two-component system nitrogen regulation sensor histidine kinase GlnL